MTEEERIFARTTEKDFERFWEVMAELRGTQERETIIDCLHLMTGGYDPDLKSWSDLERAPPKDWKEQLHELHLEIDRLKVQLKHPAFLDQALNEGVGVYRP